METVHAQPHWLQKWLSDAHAPVSAIEQRRVYALGPEAVVASLVQVLTGTGSLVRIEGFGTTVVFTPTRYRGGHHRLLVAGVRPCPGGTVLEVTSTEQPLETLQARRAEWAQVQHILDTLSWRLRDPGHTHTAPYEAPPAGLEPAT